ncbi:MAG: queuosine precursor transporter [Chloroflexi bacterium]|nr:queuosine precursor transporter [Chloroflexota bacterium]
MNSQTHRPAPLVTPFSLVTAALFVTALVTANIIAVKIARIGPFNLPAGVIIFPLSYILGDILTEVYGYRFARSVIWLGFLCNLIAVLAIYGGRLLPSAPFWQGQEAYDAILGYTPRLLAASFAGYLVGGFSNSLILARMKLLTRGRWLWSRTIASTIVGQGLDSAVFITLAFSSALGGFLTGGQLVEVLLTQWWAKVLYEAAATPLTYGVVTFLKRREGVDAYDRDVSFNPFALFR